MGYANHLSKYLKVRFFVFSVSFISLIALFSYQERELRRISRENLSHHGDVLAGPLWKIDRETTYQYIKLASRTDNYLKASVFLYPDESPFVTISETWTGNFEKFLLRSYVYRTFTINAPVKFGDDEIGSLKVVVVNKKTPLYLLECLSILILDSLLVRMLIFFREKKNLEDKVRTARTQFRESEARFKTLVDNIPGISYRCLPNENWTMTYMSDEVETVTGYASHEVQGDREHPFFTLIDPVDRARVTRTVFEALEKRIPFTVEYAIIRRDGSRCWIYDRGQGIFDSGEEVQYIDGVILDITEQKKIKDEKDILEHQFHQAQKRESIGRLAGGIAHDFNNLLTPILGFSDLILEEAKSKGLTVTYVEEIIQAAEKAKKLIHQLLSYSRNQTLNKERFSLNDLLLSFEILLKGTLKENIAFSFDLGEGIPEIYADKGQIEQVVMNIVVNAQDAMPGGGKLRISTLSSAGHVSLRIADTGCGMDEETKEHIFEPFFSTKGKLGTGLGLSTVYGIIRQQNGTIDLESRIGEGTEIIINLPLEKEVSKNG